jgi:hypothetical protein
MGNEISNGWGAIRDIYGIMEGMKCINKLHGV